MHPTEPCIMTLENALLKRLDRYHISDNYSFVDYEFQGELDFAKKFLVK